ncbi:M1 family metallopeptidase [Aurantibacillus circumpalustris]|uniref:M1 family metallopeptidase n=1 Tax=Aurantibacillus circumpalustris TaxID=3036359 RepID=UPI00295BECFB|nr:M1 family metallopeptidase [Aurantibacillus circumpalustris]
MSIGLNYKNKTPRNPSKLPRFTYKDSLLGYNNANRNCFDVKYYDIHLTINTNKKNIAGFVTTRFELLKESKKIQLDLAAQFVIDSITQNSKRLIYKRSYTAIEIELISKNKKQEVAVYYHGKPIVAKRPPWEGGFVWKKDKNKKPFVSVACEGLGAQTWLPVKTYLGDEPDSISIHLTVPEELTAVSNGNLISISENKNQKTFHWQTSYSINPYNITFYVGDYKKMEEPYECENGETMNLNYYVLPENFEKAKTHFLQTAKILKVYEDLFGTYPWVKNGFKLVESPFAGMEHQTAIAYGNGYRNERGFGFDYIILHESAHEWWGNAVSVNDFSDLWIHEGMATYAEALYVERTQGYQSYLNYMNWTAIGIKNKKSVVGPRDVYYSDYKDGDPYNKGAIMLHSLRNHVNNDTLFFAILKTFFKNKCYKNTTTSEFIELVNEMTGKDLSCFFDQYLYQRNSPYLKWNFNYDQEKTRLIFKFDRVNDCFTMSVEVQQGDKIFRINPTNRVQYLTLPEPATTPVRVNLKNTYLQDGYKKIK